MKVNGEMICEEIRKETEVAVEEAEGSDLGLKRSDELQARNSNNTEAKKDKDEENSPQQSNSIANQAEEEAVGDCCTKSPNSGKSDTSSHLQHQNNGALRREGIGEQDEVQQSSTGGMNEKNNKCAMAANDSSPPSSSNSLTTSHSARFAESIEGFSHEIVATLTQWNSLCATVVQTEKEALDRLDIIQQHALQLCETLERRRDEVMSRCNKLGSILS